MAVQTAVTNARRSRSAVDSSDDDLDDTDGGYEPVRPATAQRRQLLDLVPAPTDPATLALGAAVVTLGGALGFWLARRKPEAPARPMKRAATRVEAAVDLAPLIIRLLSNPMMRTLILRIVMRQISSRIGR